MGTAGPAPKAEHGVPPGRLEVQLPFAAVHEQMPAADQQGQVLGMMVPALDSRHEMVHLRPCGRRGGARKAAAAVAG